MASKKSSFSTNEAVNFLIADDYSASDCDSSGSEVPNEEFADDDYDLNVRNQTLPEVAQRGSCRTRGTINNFRRPGIRTRGGSNARMEKINDTRLRIERKLEDSWSKINTEPKIHEFTADTGLQVLFDPNTATLLDFLRLFLTDDFFQLISGETNLYAEQYIEANPENPTSKTWSPTTPNEIKFFLVLYLLTGIVQKPQIKQFWSTNPHLQSALFNQVMAQNRFTEILKFLHFVDNSNYNANDPNRNILYKVWGIVEFLVDQFKNVYIATQPISIHEELLLWKGRLSFKQHILSKC